MRNNNVKEISSKGDTVQGEFKKEVKYKGDKATDFETEIPTFANKDELSSLLTTNNVTINAESPTAARCSQTILFSFGPTILLVAPVHLPDPARGGRGGRRRGARPVRPLAGEAGGVGDPDRQLRRRRRHRRGRGAAGRGGRLPQEPGALPQARRAHPARRAAGRAARAPARRCSPERWPARRTCRSSRRRRPSSSRRSWASAPRACATSSSRPRRPPGDHLHRRARRDRPRPRRQRRGRRRPRRARADAQPDPHGDGRLRPGDRRDRAGRDQPPRRARSRPCCGPGRFDRRVFVQAPDSAGREQILRVHTRSVPLDADVDLGQIAQTTPGMVGADLANLVNEARPARRQAGPRQGRSARTSPTRSRRSCWAPSARSS